MATPYKFLQAGVESPAQGAFAITPHNTNELPYAVRAVTLPQEGAISFQTVVGGPIFTTGTLPVGTYPLFAVIIRVTGTTATGMTGWI